MSSDKTKQILKFKEMKKVQKFTPSELSSMLDLFQLVKAVNRLPYNKGNVFLTEYTSLELTKEDIMQNDFAPDWILDDFKNFETYLSTVYDAIDFELALEGVQKLLELNQPKTNKKTVSGVKTLPPVPNKMPTNVIEVNEVNEVNEGNEVNEVNEGTTVNDLKDDKKVLDLLSKLLLSSGTIDENKIKEIVQNELKNSPQTVTKVYEFKGVQKTVNGMHTEFTTLLNLVNYPNRSVWMFGEMGTGKTFAVQKVAETLNLKFYAKSCGNATQAYEFLGFMNAVGDFVATDFYEAYVNGGVFCLDEVDNASPNVLTVLNSALSNGFCSFANGMQQRHENFRLVATANSLGNGATAKYVGRLKLDEATKDRFNFLKWDYCKETEILISGCTPKQYERFTELRKLISEKGLNISFSVRSMKAIIDLVPLLGVKKAYEVSFLDKLSSNDRASLSTFNFDAI